MHTRKGSSWCGLTPPEPGGADTLTTGTGEGARGAAAVGGLIANAAWLPRSPLAPRGGPARPGGCAAPTRAARPRLLIRCSSMSATPERSSSRRRSSRFRRRSSCCREQESERVRVLGVRRRQELVGAHEIGRSPTASNGGKFDPAHLYARRRGRRTMRLRDAAPLLTRAIAASKPAACIRNRSNTAKASRYARRRHWRRAGRTSTRLSASLGRVHRARLSHGCGGRAETKVTASRATANRWPAATRTGVRDVTGEPQGIRGWSGTTIRHRPPPGALTRPESARQRVGNRRRIGRSGPAAPTLRPLDPRSRS